MCNHMDTPNYSKTKRSIYAPGCVAKPAQGFSIVELLIAVTIGLIILSGVINVVVKSKTNKLQQDEIAFIQDNARFVVETLTSEIRMAGYMGCASPSTSMIANSTNSE